MMVSIVNSSLLGYVFMLMANLHLFDRGLGQLVYGKDICLTYSMFFDCTCGGRLLTLNVVVGRRCS